MLSVWLKSQLNFEGHLGKCSLETAFVCMMFVCCKNDEANEDKNDAVLPCHVK